MSEVTGIEWRPADEAPLGVWFLTYPETVTDYPPTVARRVLVPDRAAGGLLDTWQDFHGRYAFSVAWFAPLPAFRSALGGNHD